MEENNKSMISVSIISFDEGLKTYDNVEAIRIINKDYRLLIMADHAPILGEVDGNMYIVTKEDEYKYENVKGFFTHIHNVFKFVES